MFLKVPSAKPVAVRNVYMEMSIFLAVLKGYVFFVGARDVIRPKTSVIFQWSTTTTSNVNTVITGSAPKRFEITLHYLLSVRMTVLACVAFVVVDFVLIQKRNRYMTMNFLATYANTAMEANAAKS